MLYRVFIFALSLIVSSSALIADKNFQIVSIEPAFDSVSIAGEQLPEFKNLRHIQVQEPKKIGAEEFELMRYAVQIGTFRNASSFPLYIWKGSHQTFSGTLDNDAERFQKEISKMLISSQLAIYDLNESSKVAVWVNANHHKVTFYLNDSVKPISEFSFNGNGHRQVLQERLVRQIVSSVLRTETKLRDFSSLEKVDSASIVRSMEVAIQKGERKISPKVYYGFDTVRDETIRVQGNPSLMTFVTEIVSLDHKLSLDRVVSGDEKDLRSYLKENFTKDSSIVRTETDLIAQIKIDNEKLKFLKQDLDQVIIETTPSSIARAVQSIVSFFDGKISWDLMPENLKSQDDLYEALEDVIGTAKRLHIPDVVLLNGVGKLVDMMTSTSGFKSVKGPDHYIILKKEISLGGVMSDAVDFIPSSVSLSDIKINFYVGVIQDRLVHWMTVDGI